MRKQELPQPVSQLLGVLENDATRKISKAQFALDKKVSQILTDFARQVSESDGLLRTPKVQVQNDGLMYDFWIEERYEAAEGDQRTRRTALCVLPEDDTEAYEMAKIEDGTILDISDNELEVGEIESLSRVFDFLRDELNRARVPAWLI
ncbi:MAG: hypothetical protein M1372_03085 [Patescibacteria group bacterium]|nr:hypothetical protein [Patescibacteria group bacterium]